MERLIHYLNRVVELSEEEQAYLKETLRIDQFKKGEMLLKEGDISTSFFFNLEGFVRLFYTTDPDEKTAYFYPPNSFISAYESFTKQTPVKFNFQAIQPTTVVTITTKATTALLAASPKFGFLAQVIMEDELAAHQNIIASLLTLTPEERYFQLMEERPDILNQVPQHYIASYIGVQPESLSRIKRRHLKKS